MKHFTFSSAALLLLASCVVQQQASAPAVRPAVTSSGPRIINKTVPAGKTITISGVTALNPDCSSPGINTLKIIKQPEHGTVKVVQRDGYTSYPPQNPRSACNKTKHPGIYADYTPEHDFSGMDTVAVEIITVDGQDFEEKVMITVK